MEISCYYHFQSFYTNPSETLALPNVIQGIVNSILELGDSRIVEVPLDGQKSLDILGNTNILDTAIDFLFHTKRFDEKLF